MRRAARRDMNEAAIVEALRAAGASVEIMGNGSGVPDLLVGFAGRTLLLEVKLPLGARGGKRGGGSTRPGKGGNGTLTADQIDWHRSWRGAPPVIVRTPAEALAAIGASPGRWVPRIGERVRAIGLPTFVGVVAGYLPNANTMEVALDAGWFGQWEPEKFEPEKPENIEQTAATAWDRWAAGSLDHRPGAYDDVPGIGPDPTPENVPAKPAKG